MIQAFLTLLAIRIRLEVQEPPLNQAVLLAQVVLALPSAQAVPLARPVLDIQMNRLDRLVLCGPYAQADQVCRLHPVRRARPYHQVGQLSPADPLHRLGQTDLARL